MPPAVPVASTETRTIIQFDAGTRHRYRFSERDRSACVPNIEDPKSGHCRLRFHKATIRNLIEIQGIVWDDQTVNWSDSLLRLDPKKTLVLVLWKGIDRPVWEFVKDFKRIAPLWYSAGIWSEIAEQQEERFEDEVTVLRTRGNDESGSYVRKGALSNQ